MEELCIVLHGIRALSAAKGRRIAIWLNPPKTIRDKFEALNGDPNAAAEGYKLKTRRPTSPEIRGIVLSLGAGKNELEQNRGPER